MKTKTALALTAVLAVSLAFGAPGASAQRLDPPGHRDSNQCVNSFGVDLNELFGISDQIVRSGCQEESEGGTGSGLLVGSAARTRSTAHGDAGCGRRRARTSSRSWSRKAWSIAARAGSGRTPSRRARSSAQT